LTMKNSVNFYCRKYVRILLAVLFLVGLQGCREPSTPQINARQTLLTHSVNGFQVPIFPSAEEQFNYTNSWFEKREEKKAALAAVSQFFPKALEQRGAAALELTYMELGRDYRQATPEDCRKAIENYRKIITRFHTLPEICAKAYWYMGWIYCDLLKEKEKGLEMYRLVVAHYPHIRRNLTPPVPWVTFITPTDTNPPPAQENANPLWADLARIEIIRYSDTADAARRAFFGLRQGNGNQQMVGIALKLLLHRQDLGREAVPFAEEYLQKPLPNPALQKDIRQLLANMELTGEGDR